MIESGLDVCQRQRGGEGGGADGCYQLPIERTFTVGCIFQLKTPVANFSIKKRVNLSVNSI